jgi:CelD/BcsL family acetyltransferase involved in cellulose biosynthesis
MTTVVAVAIRWAIGERLRTVNLSTGRDVSKTRWGPREVVYREAIRLQPGARARLAHRGYEHMVKLKASARLGGALRLLGRRGRDDADW